MKFLPTPGTVLIEPHQEESRIVTQTKDVGHILQGKVVASGEPLITDFNAHIKCPVAVGDIVWFLSYEGDYDNRTVAGVKYYVVSFKDLRGVIK